MNKKDISRFEMLIAAIKLYWLSPDKQKQERYLEIVKGIAISPYNKKERNYLIHHLDNEPKRGERIDIEALILS